MIPQWLIERGQPEGQVPTVWLENSALHPASHKHWTTEANEAAMFPTKKDADKWIDEYLSHPVRGPSARATEHIWFASTDDEPCSSPVSGSVSGLVDTATLPERLEDYVRAGRFAATMGPATAIVPLELLIETVAALSSLETRLEEVLGIRDGQVSAVQKVIEERTARLAAEAREKAQRQTAEHNWQERVAAEAREKALIERLARIEVFEVQGGAYHGLKVVLESDLPGWPFALAGVRGQGKEGQETGGLQSRPSGGGS